MLLSRHPVVHAKSETTRKWATEPQVVWLTWNDTNIEQLDRKLYNKSKTTRILSNGTGSCIVKVKWHECEQRNRKLYSKTQLSNGTGSCIVNVKRHKWSNGTKSCIVKVKRHKIEQQNRKLYSKSETTRIWATEPEFVYKVKRHEIEQRTWNTLGKEKQWNKNII